jgi:hypothetical protein
MHRDNSAPDILAEKAAATFARLRAQEQAQLATRAADALAMVDELARVALAHGTKRVWLFGLLATGQWRKVDVDLAVEGVADAIHLSAVLDRIARPFAVDVVEMESAPALLRDEILAHGRLVAPRLDAASGADRAWLQRLRTFRHFFGHAYAVQLGPHRLLDHAGALQAGHDRLIAQDDALIAHVEAVLANLAA